jgi:hypothetical protein
VRTGNGHIPADLADFSLCERLKYIE